MASLLCFEQCVNFSPAVLQLPSASALPLVTVILYPFEYSCLYVIFLVTGVDAA